MGVQKEVWIDDIIEGLYKENPFLDKCVVEDDYVINGSVVHIPQAGAASGVVKNRSSLPATAVKRTDTDVTYTLDEYTTNPRLIPNIDTIQLSYNKRDSAMGEDRASLNEQVADDMLYRWAPAGAAQILRTLGSARPGEANGTATGDRKKFTKESILALQKKMNKQKIPKKGRILLLPSEFLADLEEDTDLVKRDNAGELNLAEGVVRRLYGFDIYERATVLTYDNAGTPVVKDPLAAGAATDNAAAIAWHPSVVCRALGLVKMFDSVDNPLYFGDIYSFLVMAGGRKRRADGAGIFAVVEAAA